MHYLLRALLLATALAPPLGAQDRPLPTELNAVYERVRAALDAPDAPFALVVVVEAVEGGAADLERAYAAHAERSRREPGVLAFDVYRPRGAGRVVLHERYASLAAFEAHLRAPSLAQFVRDADGLIEGRDPLAVATVRDAPPTPSEHPLVQVDLVDGADGARRVRSVTVADDDGGLRVVPAEALVRPTVEAYTQAPAGIIVAFGTPAPPGTPTGLRSETGAALPPPPAGARAAVLADGAANSALFNLAALDDSGRPGARLRFPGGLVNGPGPDLVLADVSVPLGGMSAACPGVGSPGGDPFWLGVAGDPDRRARFGPDVYRDLGPAGVIVNYGAERLGDPGAQLASLAALDELDAEPLAAVGYFHLFGAALDLADLGVAEGARVEALDVWAAPVRVDGPDGETSCFHLDPALVVGLPPAPGTVRRPDAQAEARATVEALVARVEGAVADPDAPFGLLVQFRARPGHLDAVVASYAEQARRSRGVRGNLAYEVYRDPADPDALTLYERWEDLGSFVRHERSAHTVTHFVRVGSLLGADRSLRVLIPTAR